MSGPPGRDRLLDAAEKLFAEQGVEATSARAINAAADLSPAALHYHFGNKEKIVKEVLHRRATVLNQRRTAVLEAVRRKERTIDAVGLAEVIVQPLADFALGDGKPGHSYVRFLSRLFAERPGVIVQFLDENFPEIVRMFDDLVQGVAPSLAMDEVRIRRIIAGETAIHSLAHICLLFEKEPDARTRAEPLLGSLIAFIAGGLVAPPA